MTSARDALSPHLNIRSNRRAFILVAILAITSSTVHADVIKLSDQPVFTAVTAPANILITPSVEFPTANSHGNPTSAANATTDSGFVETTPYLGYFDPNKCYAYDSTNSRFSPYGFVAGYTSAGTNPTNNYTCGTTGSGWSGSFLNWSTMTTIDIFRWVLTGGNRVIDNPAPPGTKYSSSDTYSFSSPLTVLRRSYNSFQGSKQNFPDKILSSSLINKYVKTSDFSPTLSTASNLTVVNKVTGTSGTPSSFVGYGFTSTFATTGSPVTLTMQVEVCKSGNDSVLSLPLRESNCTAYSDSSGSNTIYKPTGLIQQNADAMRFGIFGYLNDSISTTGVSSESAADTENLKIDGAVLRAPMHGTSGTLDSTGREIAPNGTFYSDPLGVSGANSALLGVKSGDTVSNSGVINYLNKFGDTSHVYKRYDPVSEMYAEAVKYLQYNGTGSGTGPTASYYNTTLSNSSSPTRATLMDGFPVISQWTTPITSSAYCAKNFILGIGDTNTQADRNLKNVPTHDGTHEPTLPSDVLNVDAYNWTTQVGTAEGISGLQDHTIGSNDAGFLIAGLAYYARTQDLRPDLKHLTTGGSNIPHTASTFWVDVLEFSQMAPPASNQYWLATKYGGFQEDPDHTNYLLDASTDTWISGRTYKDINGTTDNLPMNYYPANNANALVSGLTSAFQQINALVASGAGVGLQAPDLANTSGENGLYQVKYFTSPSWYGDVVGQKFLGTFTINSDGSQTPNTSQQWSAKDNLKTQLGTGSASTTNAASRKVITMNGTNAVSFTRSSLSTAQQALLGSSSTVVDSVISYLRGDSTNEGTTATNFRKRAYALGDIVDSEAVYVGKPIGVYSDAFNPGYSSFVSTVNNSNSGSGRISMVYVGANDGMLHAFTGALDSTGGKETWAYIPSLVIGGPTNTPTTNGLVALTRQDYAHHYYVDATPTVRDVDFKRTADSTGALPTVLNTVYDWHTLLVGGLGKGGKGFYALDVTTPVTNSTSLATTQANVLWEFTDADMGYSYGKPLIIKTRQWGWVVMVTSGYNNRIEPIPPSTTGSGGKGWLYILNAKTGALLLKVAADTATPSIGSYDTPSGFTQINGYSPSFADYTADYVYGGDLLGNMWRFDFVNASTTNVPVTRIAALGATQPITNAPQIEYDVSSLNKWVFFGTGKLLDNSDWSTSNQQGFYAIRDGFQSAGFPASSFSSPLTNTDLAQVTDLTTGIAASAAPKGWYYSYTGTGERTHIPPKANAGIIAFSTFIPDASDPLCNPDGTSRDYALNFATGKTAFYTTSGSTTTPVSYITSNSSLVKIQFVAVSGGQISLLGSNASGGTSTVGNALGGVTLPHVTNWRVIDPQ